MKNITLLSGLAIMLYSLFMSCDKHIIFEEYDMFGESDPSLFEISETSLTYLTRLGNADCTNIPVPIDRYHYPLVPGTEEYNAAMRSIGSNGVAEVNKIPKGKIESLSTEAIIWAYFDYPYI